MSLLLALQGVNPGMPNWDPERELPQEEARVITPEQFRSGVVPVTDPRLIQYFIEHPAELQRIDPRKFE